MAVTPVGLGPSLRALALAGVTHILCDGDVDAVFLGEGGRSVNSPAVPNAASRPLPATPPPLSGREGQSGSRPTEVQDRPPSPARRPAAPQALSDAPGPQGAASGESGPLIFAPREAAFADPAGWPEPWSGWYAKIAPGPVLWTYHELGSDLTGIGRSPERSLFFKELIGELRMPRGSSVFWPSAMPVTNEGGQVALREHPVVFATGLARLMPQIVVVFGETALADIGLAGKVQRFRQAMVEGKLLVCLPEIDSLLQDQALRAASVSLLRAVLGSVNFG